MRTAARIALGLIVALLALAFGSAASATNVPPQALEHLPTLRSVQERIWPHAPIPSFLAAQIEQESCITLKHSRCWNPRVELKTHREYGFGLGQTTIAYNADGSVRFDTWSELRAKHASLAGWTWERRYDPVYQMTAIVEMDRAIWHRLSDVPEWWHRLAMTLAAYNGGESGVRQDRLLCRNTGGCDPLQWFGHVEHTSAKRRTPYKGDGKSPFEINREYPVNVMSVRRKKYVQFFQ